MIDFKYVRSCLLKARRELAGGNISDDIDKLIVRIDDLLRDV